MRLELVTRGPGETQSIGAALGRAGRPGDWIGLTGELGAGKTCLVQGLAAGAGVAEDVPVNSPTFVIHRAYPGRLTVNHLDMYRIESPVELDEIGYGELVDGDGLCAVEWFEKLPEADPGRGLMISLELIDETTRRLVLDSRCPRGTELLGALEAYRSRGS